MQLKERLQAVADFIQPGSTVADIGTDHAYLPIDLVRRGIVQRALACDVHEGPYRAACQAVARAGLTDQIAMRLGDGIAAIALGEADTVVIAGMGGATMLEILKARPEIANALTSLVLQPMNAAASLRKWLADNHWHIQAETLVVEEGRLYEIIRAKRGIEPVREPIFYEIGPRLWEDRHPLLARHIAALLAQAQRVLTGMAASEAVKMTEKYSAALKRAQRLEEMYRCL